MCCRTVPLSSGGGGGVGSLVGCGSKANSGHTRWSMYSFQLSCVCRVTPYLRMFRISSIAALASLATNAARSCVCVSNSVFAEAILAHRLLLRPPVLLRESLIPHLIIILACNSALRSQVRIADGGDIDRLLAKITCRGEPVLLDRKWAFFAFGQMLNCPLVHIRQRIRVDRPVCAFCRGRQPGWELGKGLAASGGGRRPRRRCHGWRRRPAVLRMFREQPL